MNLQALWGSAVQRYTELPCLGQWRGQPYEPWTYAETNLRVQGLARILRAEGLVMQDRVGLWSANQPAWGALSLAVQTSGLIFVPFLPDFPIADVARCLAHAEAKLFVVSEQWQSIWTNWVATPCDEAGLEAVRQWAQSLKVVVLEELLKQSVTDQLGEVSGEFQQPQPDQIASLFYTSGTTGSPKGVLLSHANLVSNILAGAKIAQIRPGDRLLSILPLAHAYEGTLGFLIPMTQGGHVTYLCKPPSPAVLLPALNAVRPHLMLSVPLFIEKVVRQKIRPKLAKLGFLMVIPGLQALVWALVGRHLKKLFGGRLRFFGIGGAQLAPEVETLLRHVGFPYAIGYGLTETSPLVAGTYSLLGRPFSTGPVLDGVLVRIDTSAGEAHHQPVDDGVGEIQVKGPNVFVGYWKDPQRTHEVMTSDGWFKTGDLGMFDETGNLFIKGRLKNLILGPNGENVYPEAIEALLNESRLVVESLVVARGRDLVAKVVLNAEALNMAVHQYLDELLAGVNSQLSRAARLSAVEVQETPFEKTATMKIKRFLYN